MITNLRLGNFKAFEKAQKIPIKPITLIFGPNSGGKSSLIHSLLLAHHAITVGELDVHSTRIGGEAVDLGGFRQFVHRRELKRQVEWGVEIEASQLTGKTAVALSNAKTVSINLAFGIPQSNKGIIQNEPTIISYEMKVDNKSLFCIKQNENMKLQLRELNFRHEVLRENLKGMFLMATTTHSLTNEDYNVIDTVKDDVVIESKNFLPVIVYQSITNDSMPKAIGKDTREQDIARVAQMYLPQALDNIISGVSDYIVKVVGCFRYLGPLRSYPQRHVIFKKPYDPNWYSGGAYAWEVLRKDMNVRNTVNEWLKNENRLKTPYELVVRELASQNFNQELDECIEPLEDDGISELLLIDKRSKTIVSHRDVGVGISQILPVLVSAYAYDNQVIAIEQPEIHLHPALQAELGDIFIQSAIGKKQNTFLLETHSEHLILRIMRRIRETTEKRLPEGIPPISPNDVSIVYIEPRISSSIAKIIRLDDYGQLLDPWPGGFFEEGFNERFS